MPLGQKQIRLNYSTLNSVDL